MGFTWHVLEISLLSQYSEIMAGFTPPHMSPRARAHFIEKYSLPARSS